jgi:hypothetical protein
MEHLKYFKLFEKNWTLTINIEKEWSELSDYIGESDDIEDIDEFYKLLSNLTIKLKTYVDDIKEKFDIDTVIEYENISLEWVDMLIKSLRESNEEKLMLIQEIEDYLK